MKNKLFVSGKINEPSRGKGKSFSYLIFLLVLECDYDDEGLFVWKYWMHLRERLANLIGKLIGASFFVRIWLIKDSGLNKRKLS